MHCAESRALDESKRHIASCNSAIPYFEYANHDEITDHNPCRGLHQVLAPVQERHHASITDPKRVGELLRAIAAFNGTLPVASALRLAPLVFVRPGELRKAVWSEFELDGDEPLWRILAQQWQKDAIERQLAHGERDKVRGSYNFAEHLPERRRMMQAWADYLDNLRTSASKVVPLKRTG